jgi:hypothetical protein
MARAFQANAFQFNPTAFELETVTASGTLGVTDGFSGQFGLARFVAVNLGTIAGQNNTARVTRFGNFSVGLKGAVSATSGNVLRASISLGTKQNMARSWLAVPRVNTALATMLDGFSVAARETEVAVAAIGANFSIAPTAKDALHAAATLSGLSKVSASSSNVLRGSIGLGTKGNLLRSSLAVLGASTALALVDRLLASAKMTEVPVTSIGGQFGVAPAAKDTLRGLVTLGETSGLVNRQEFIRPSLIASTNRLNFQCGISHRGGGKAKARQGFRKIEPEKRPPTFKDFLKSWKPPPFELPAPHLVGKSRRDLRPAPKPKPLEGDLMAIDRALSDALDHRDAFAMLEALLHHQDLDRAAQDEQDAMELLEMM